MLEADLTQPGTHWSKILAAMVSDTGITIDAATKRLCELYSPIYHPAIIRTARTLGGTQHPAVKG